MFKTKLWKHLSSSVNVILSGICIIIINNHYILAESVAWHYLKQSDTF